MRIGSRPGGTKSVVMLVLAGLALAVIGCGGAGGTATTLSAPSSIELPLPADEDTIAVNFVTFFNGSLPAADRVALLENGDAHMSELETFAASPVGPRISATLSSVTITSPTEASVAYSILIDGQPALADQIGKAVLQGGEWKVSETTFQVLLTLQGGSTPPAG